MKKLILTIIILFVISGCGGNTIKKPAEVPEKAYVKVPVDCPALELLDIPTLPIYSITKDTPDQEVAKDYTKSITILENKIGSYESMVNTCKEKQPQENE